MSEGRIVVNPFLHGKLRDYGELMEPDIDEVFQRWLARHPEFQGATREYQIIRARTNLENGVATILVRVTAAFSSDLDSYDPDQDIDLYEDFLAEGQLSDRASGKLLVECSREWLLELAALMQTRRSP